MNRLNRIARSRATQADSRLRTGSARLRVELLEDRSVPALIAVGADAGGGPHVKVFDAATGTEVHNFFAYDPSFTGGVKVALGDVTGDGNPDIITAPGSGGGPHVKVFDGVTLKEVRSFFAYDLSVTRGVWVAAANVNGDAFTDIVTGPGFLAGGPHVKVFDGRTGAEIHSFFAYDPAFVGGVIVAGGDTDGDGRGEIITSAWKGGGPHVKVFDGRTLEEELGFFAYEKDFNGGVWVSSGDVTGDGRDDIVTAPGSGANPVKLFDGATGRLHSELPIYQEPDTGFTFSPTDVLFAAGIRVGATDHNRDGNIDIIVGAGPATSSHVKVIDGVKINELTRGGAIEQLAEIRSFAAFDPAFTGGIFVGGGRVNTPPTFVNRSVTSPIVEGDTATLTGTIVDPDPWDIFYLDVDWGDGVRKTFKFGPGADGTTVNITHTYEDENPEDRYIAKLSWRDDYSSGKTADLEVVTQNVAPKIQALKDVVLRPGDSLVRTVSFTDPGKDLWTAQVDYGDGSRVQQFSVGRQFDINHTYLKAGSYTVRIQTADDDGGVDEATFVVLVR